MSAPTMRLPARLVLVIGGLAFASCPSRAEAHLVTTGLGPLYDGLLHVALTPEDLVPVLALALLAGLRGVAHGRRALFVLPAAWLLGGVIGLAVHGGASPSWTALSFVLLGGLVVGTIVLGGSPPDGSIATAFSTGTTSRRASAAPSCSTRRAPQ